MAITDDLAILVRQERELQLPHFNEETAWEIGLRLRDWARARQLAVVIDLHRFGQPLFYSALAGSTPDNVNWVRRKSNVVAHFHRSSYRVGLELEQRQSNLLEKYGLPSADYASHGGSFPLTVAGAGIIGAVTVSGLPQRADHELVVEALCVQLGKAYAGLALP
jgi:uncharacterized protein (UPF0303 family)